MQGRLNRESNPAPKKEAGFTPQYKENDGSYTDVSPANPWPSKDADVKAELELIKSTQQAILDRLDSPIDTQVTGSIQGLSTDAKPKVIEGYSYLEYDVEAQEMNVYKGISGEWRLM